MKNKRTKPSWINYAKRNWFNISVVLFLVFIFVNKDFSFQFNLNAPAKLNQPTPKKDSSPAIKASKKEERGAYSKNKTKKTILERLELPFIGNFRKEKMDPSVELSKIDEQIKRAYLKRFAHVAISERKKFGIPSSIILANALIHSFAGRRDLSQTSNNQFAIVCGSNWKGQNSFFDENCYRKYDNAWMSFRDHSQYITTGKFAKLTKLDPADYKAWAKALDRQGFSNVKYLERNLIKIIEVYQLQELDFR